MLVATTRKRQSLEFGIFIHLLHRNQGKLKTEKKKSEETRNVLKTDDVM